MCRYIVPFALALTAFAGSNALAQGISAGSPALPTQVSSPVVPSSPPLTLASAIQLALDGNPEISSARRELEATEGARIQAGVFQNPTLSVDVEDVRRDTRTTTVLLSQPLELGGGAAP